MPALLPRDLHTTDRPSVTALATLAMRAAELHRPPEQRILSDPFAPVLLDCAGPLGVATRTAVAAGYPVRAALRAGERTALAAIATSALCRHRALDEHLLAALPLVEQAVILGAGYDARAYRFAGQIGDRPVFEVDLPPLSRRKAAFVARRATVFGHGAVRPVEIDFRTQSLASVLIAAGFTTGAPTFIAWEGVSMYLTRDAVDATLGALVELTGPGSVLAMDFWAHPDGRGVTDRLRALGQRGLGLVGEPVTFACAPDEAIALLSARGLRVADMMTPDVLTDRYATDGRRCDPGLYAVAATR